MKKATNYFIGSCLTLTSLTASSQIGSLDNTFGTGGKVTTDFGGFEDNVNTMVIQSDGKIIVAGNFSLDANGSSYDCFLARYNSDGTLDNTFGTNGKVITDFGNNFESFNSVTLQGNGKIVVVGDANYNIIMARYTINGVLDNTFGNGGKVITDFGNGDSEEGYAVAIQSDGKILVGGETNTISTDAWFDMAVVRYDSAGNIDNTFGTNGIATTDFGNAANEYCRSIALQNDGKIVIAGFRIGTSPNYTDFAVARFNSTGTLDSSFATNGQLTEDFGTSGDKAQSVVIQPDDKIIVAGYNDNGSNAHFAMARYNSNGTLDNTFGTNGKVITQISTYTDNANSAALQSDGKIVLSGYGWVSGAYGFILARYNTNGSLDNTFGTGGIVTTTFGTNGDYAYSLVIQNDGKVVLAGKSATGFTSSSFDIALARYNTSVTTGLETISQNRMQAKIYPNPGNGLFYVDNTTGEAFEMKLYNEYGQVLYNEKSPGKSAIIDIQNFAPGIYMLVIKQEDKVTTSKLIKN